MVGAAGLMQTTGHGRLILLTGLSGAGKTTLGYLLVKHLTEFGSRPAYFLDGDVAREFFGNDVGYSLAERDAAARRMAFGAHLLVRQNIDVVMANIAGSKQTREFFRRRFVDYIEVYLDVVFPKDTPLPTRGAPALTVERRYRAAHNIGHFRYVESSQVRDGQPDGDLMPWDEIRVPYDPALRERKSLAGVSVRRLEGDGPMVEEVYRCTAEGTLEVSVTVDDGARPEGRYSQTFHLARRSGGKPPRRGSAAHAG